MENLLEMLHEELLHVIQQYCILLVKLHFNNLKACAAEYVLLNRADTFYLKLEHPVDCGNIFIHKQQQAVPSPPAGSFPEMHHLLL